MKKSFAVLCFVILFCITGCSNTTSDSENNMASVNEALEEHTPTALIPAVMIDGTIYYLSQGHNIPEEKLNRDQIDYTVSEVPLGTYPEKDGESNYALAGTPYVKYENGYALQIEENGWTLFLTWEDRLMEE